jgi:hypothetical protein
MKSIVVLSALAATLFSMPALADPSGLPTAWPTRVQAEPSAPEVPPSNGNVLIFSGLGMSLVGGGLSAYGVYQGMHSDQMGLAYGLLIGGTTLAVAGSVCSMIGMVQGIRYVDWMNKHPVMRTLALGAGSVGYRMAF